mmetsp:Transcript_80062/g.141292  ORF Transcript_80062/g.141292 Transcript_80062/m.141292 type:complete len:130 (-) Transcript_80062:70-459(-)
MLAWELARDRLNGISLCSTLINSHFQLILHIISDFVILPSRDLLYLPTFVMIVGTWAIKFNLMCMTAGSSKILKRELEDEDYFSPRGKHPRDPVSDTDSASKTDMDSRTLLGSISSDDSDNYSDKEQSI